MPHPKPHEIIPIGTVCWWSRNGSRPIKVKITGHGDLKGKFLHYEGIKQGQNVSFAFYHDDLTPIKN
jgi:hypothetical protein